MHIPVLQREVIQYINPKPNENFIDCTIGNGGHSLAILERNGPKGKLLGIDADRLQIENCKLKIKKFKKRVILVVDSFVNLKKIVKKKKFRNVQGILFDLGFSSWHLEKSGRGFSFLKNEPLIMRYNWKDDGFSQGLTAEKIVNQWPAEEIERILSQYGEERFAKKIAWAIVEKRKLKPIKTTFQLVEVVKAATPIWYHRQRMHLATKTFQALRIAVNDELNNLKNVLPQALEVLEKNGRLAVISFHSLEDRIVKNFLKTKSLISELKILTKKPIRPSKEEIKINHRSRSAKLRVAVKTI